MRRTSTIKVGASLELCSCPWKLCEPWLQKILNKNNYPLVQIHCIIKIMCQDLPLGCLNCLFGVCSAKTKTFAVVFEFIFLLERAKILNFFHNTALNFFSFFLIFQKFFSYRSICTICIFIDCPVFIDCCYSFFICLCLKSCWASLTWEP